MPHALWLWAKNNMTDPPPVCQCHHCLQENGATRRKEPLLKKSVTRKSINSTTPRLSPNRTRSLKPPVTTHSHSSKGTADDPSQYAHLPPQIVDSQSILACVRVAVPIAAPSASVGRHLANTWPILHELVWCKLRRSIAWADVLIDFWPGIIKGGVGGSSQYLVTLIGIAGEDVPISFDDMVPYQAYRVEEAMSSAIQRCCRGKTRIKLLNLVRDLPTEIDDSQYATISSAFLFAITFSKHLSTVWSWVPNSNVADRGSAATVPSLSRYALRSRRSKEGQYAVLWWGPERIERRQLVRLKMSRNVIEIGEGVSAVPPSAVDGSVGSEGPAFLQIHSISYWRKSLRPGGSLAGPVVAGTIFELIDKDECGE